MRNVLLLLISFLPVIGAAQGQPAYDRVQIVQWLQEGAWDEVAAAAQGIADPDSFLLQSAGYASYQAGDKIAATDYYDRLLAMDSNNRQALYYSAVMLKADEQYTPAIPLLRRLCSVAPKVSQYYVLLADCYSAKDERSAAVRHLQTARNLSPASAVIANKLANAWIKMKAWDSAGHLLTQAMNLHPRDPALIGTAISLAYSRKQFGRASALADSLIATGRLRYEALIIALYADIEQPNYPHAIRLGNILMDLGSATEDVLYYTALAHQHLGHWREADTLLRRCVARVLKPNLEGYYVALAEGAAQQQQLARSKAYYDTAYYLFKNPMTLYQSGLAMEMRGKKSEAAQLYKKYLSLPKSRQDTAVAHYMERAISQ